MDEKRANKIKQKIAYKKQEEEIEFVKDQGKSLGLAIDNMKPLELNEPVFDVEPLLSKKNGKYRIDEQHLALMFLEAFQKEDKITGELNPLFSRVEQMLDIPRTTLRGWWKRRDEIMAQQTTTINQGLNYISTGMMVEMIRMTQALSTIDYSALVSGKSNDLHNFISLFNTLINKFRLLNNQSTNNVAHQHQVEMIIPE
jgi:hypothetical protein